MKLHVISHVSSHGVRQVHSKEELDSCRALQSGVAAWGWAALWQTRGDRDVCLAHQRSPAVASVSAHMPNSSFKTYIWEKTLYAVIFTSPYQQRHSTSQIALEVLRQGLKQQKLGYMVFRHFEDKPSSASFYTGRYNHALCVFWEMVVRTTL